MEEVFRDGEYYVEGSSRRKYVERPCGKSHSLKLICRGCVSARDLAARNRAQNPIIPHLRDWVFERDGWKCVHFASPDDLTADHIIPVIQGGRTDPDNLQTLCRPCNSSKGSRT